MKLTPETLRNLLIQLCEVDLIVVGGQAINLWALQYYQPTLEWQSLQPYSSEDLDFYGGRLEAVQCAEVLQGRLTLAKDFDPTPNMGLILLDWQESRLRIDILASVYGLADAEIKNTALTFTGTESLQGVVLQVLHPMLCLETKLKCLRSLDQTNRQDEKHLRLAILILRSFFTSQLLTQPPRSLLNFIERVFDNVLTDAGLNAWYRYGIAIEAAIPLEQIQLLDVPQWQAFLSIRWEQLLAQCGEKRSRYEQLMHRLDSR